MVGRVLAEEDRLPLPGARASLEGTGVDALLDEFLVTAGRVSRIPVLRGLESATGYANGAAGVILFETIQRRSPSPPR